MVLGFGDSFGCRALLDIHVPTPFQMEIWKETQSSGKHSTKHMLTQLKGLLPNILGLRDTGYSEQNGFPCNILGFRNRWLNSVRKFVRFSRLLPNFCQQLTQIS